MSDEKDADWLLVTLLPDDEILLFTMPVWKLPERIIPEYPDMLEPLFENLKLDKEQVRNDIKAALPKLITHQSNEGNERNDLAALIRDIKNGDFDAYFQKNRGIPLFYCFALDKIGEEEKLLSLKLRYMFYGSEDDWSGLQKQDKYEKTLRKCRIIFYELLQTMKKSQVDLTQHVKELYNFTSFKCTIIDNRRYFKKMYEKMFLKRRKNAHEFVLNASILMCSMRVKNETVHANVLYFILVQLNDNDLNLFYLSKPETMRLIESVQQKYCVLKKINQFVSASSSSSSSLR